MLDFISERVYYSYQEEPVSPIQKTCSLSFWAGKEPVPKRGETKLLLHLFLGTTDQKKEGEKNRSPKNCRISVDGYRCGNGIGCRAKASPAWKKKRALGTSCRLLNLAIRKLHRSCARSESIGAAEQLSRRNRCPMHRKNWRDSDLPIQKILKKIFEKTLDIIFERVYYSVVEEPVPFGVF